MYRFFFYSAILFVLMNSLNIQKISNILTGYSVPASTFLILQMFRPKHIDIDKIFESEICKKLVQNIKPISDHILLRKDEGYFHPVSTIKYMVNFPEICAKYYVPVQYMRLIRFQYNFGQIVAMREKKKNRRSLKLISKTVVI